MTPRNRRRSKWFGVILALSLAAYLGVSYGLAPFLRHRLQDMVATYLNADLRIGSLRYHFPFRVTVRDAALVVDGPDRKPLDLVKVGSIDLRLAELPRHGKPLVIERLILRDPQVNILRLPDSGIVGGHDLVKTEALRHKEPDKRLSDMFRLRRFALDGGKIVYEDRTHHDMPPVTWTDLHVDIDTTYDPTEPARYTYRLLAENKPLAMIGSKGSFDIDDLHLIADEFKVMVRASPDTGGSDKIPGPVQQLLQQNAIRGNLVIEGNARSFYRDPAATRLDAKVLLTDASAYFPQWDAALDDVAMQLRVSTTPLAGDATASQPATAPATQPTTRPTRPPLYVQIDALRAGSHDTRLDIAKGLIDVDPEARAWRARDVLATVTLGATHDALPSRLRQLLDQVRARGKLEITATAGGPFQPPPGTRAVDAIDYELIAVPREFTFQPPKCDLPFERVTGTLYLKPSLARAQNVTAYYGGDRLFVATARLPLDDVHEKLRFQELSGTVTFGGRDEPYPKPVGGVFDTLHPRGMMHVAGAVTVRPRSAVKVEYALDITSDDGTITPEPKRLPFTGVRCDLKLRGVSNGQCVTDVIAARGTAFDGTVTAKGQLVSSVVAPGQRLLTYRGTGHAAEVDVAQLAAAWSPSGDAPPRASGKLYLDTEFAGTGRTPDGKAPADTLRAAGEFEILQGGFYRIGVIRDIATAASAKYDALTVGQAAATFELANRQVQFPHAAVSAPVLGLQGNGGIDLADGAMNFRVIAAPLASWRDQLQSTHVPLVSDGLAAVAGGIQKVLNTATRTLLYEFRITGTTTRPVMTTVPAPILTDAGATLFGSMLTAKKDDRLLTKIRPEKPSRDAAR